MYQPAFAVYIALCLRFVANPAPAIHAGSLVVVCWFDALALCLLFPAVMYNRRCKSLIVVAFNLPKSRNYFAAPGWFRVSHLVSLSPRTA